MYVIAWDMALFNSGVKALRSCYLISRPRLCTSILVVSTVLGLRIWVSWGIRCFTVTWIL